MDKHKRKMLAIRLLLGLWMSAILALQILLYPPPRIVHILEDFDLLEPFTALRNKVSPFFQTTDINEDFMINF